jgi:hypothetical protein
VSVLLAAYVGVSQPLAVPGHNDAIRKPTRVRARLARALSLKASKLVARPCRGATRAATSATLLCFQLRRSLDRSTSPRVCTATPVAISRTAMPAKMSHFFTANDSAHRWRPLCDSRTARRCRGAAIRCSARFGVEYALWMMPRVSRPMPIDALTTERGASL